MDCDVLVIGAGLAGLVAASEAAALGRKVIVLDQEGEQNLGGQAFWSLGGLFFIDSPEQRRMGIRDSRDLAGQDWMGSSQFDRPEDHWPRLWAEAYLDFAAGEKRRWLHALGLRWFPVVGWAERGGGLAHGHGNSVPRFHVTWGTGPAVLEPFIRLTREAESRGLVRFRFRHRVDELVTTDGVVTGARGAILKADPVSRGERSARDVAGDFEISAGAVIVSSGGIGG
ncbi:FAD-binding protein, partial [Sinorhizobium fredii]